MLEKQFVKSKLLHKGKTIVYDGSKGPTNAHILYRETTSTQTTKPQQSEGQPEHSGVPEWEQALESQRQTLPASRTDCEVDLFPYSFFCKLERRFLHPSGGCFKDLN